MKAETEDYLAKADRNLNVARRVMAIELPTVAARSAYFAAFHAAHALIFERTGKIAKTHSGVHSEFSRLLKIESRPAQHLSTFLARAYSFKQTEDYATGANAEGPALDAQLAVRAAEDFVAHVRTLLPTAPEA